MPTYYPIYNVPLTVNPVFLAFQGDFGPHALTERVSYIVPVGIMALVEFRFVQVGETVVRHAAKMITNFLDPLGNVVGGSELRSHREAPIILTFNPHTFIPSGFTLKVLIENTAVATVFLSDFFTIYEFPVS